VIDDELGRETTVRSPATTIGRGLKSFDIRTDSRTRLDGSMSRRLVVKTKNKKIQVLNVNGIKVY
jgi:hypothetical protein